MSEIVSEITVITVTAAATAQLRHDVDEHQEHEDAGDHQEPCATPRWPRRRTVEAPRPARQQFQRSLSLVLVIVSVRRSYR